MIECLAFTRKPVNQTGWVTLFCPPFFPPKGGQTIKLFTHPSIVVVLALLISGVTIADSNTRHYRIPAQPLTDALMQFATDTNLRLLFTADKVRGMSANSIDGSMTQAQALSKLLQGSGMTYRFVDAKTVTVELPPSNFKKTATVEETPEPQSSSDTTLPKVTVEADAEADPYDPTNITDPYNKSYSVSNSSTATKTDTPIINTPMSIQVVPKQILRDQQAYRIQDAVRNVSGVQPNFIGGGFDNFTVRGFNVETFQYRNGIRLSDLNFDLANTQQVEVLKGPSSGLYGRVEPGGLINVVTKRPQANPYYSLEQRFGSYGYFRTQADATGAITKDNH